MPLNCSCCGSRRNINDLHYYHLDNVRLCNACFKKFRKLPNTVGVAEFIVRYNNEWNNHRR